MKVSFTDNYDHRWPSGCVTAFKAGWSGTVKREAGAKAIKLGKAVEIRDAKPNSD